MKAIIIIVSLFLVFISLIIFFKHFLKANKKEKIVMTIAFFTEPLDLWTCAFYLGLLGLAYSIIFL
ncbi:MAG: hypothetical protein ABS934_10090 [Psychrobacillus sp.]